MTNRFRRAVGGGPLVVDITSSFYRVPERFRKTEQRAARWAATLVR